MKTLVVGRGAETGGRSVQVHVVQALRDIGHTVHGFDPLFHGESQMSRMQNLASLLVHTEPDVLVHVPSGEDLDAEQLQAITAELEVLTVALSSGLSFVDAPVARGQLSELIANHDVVTTADPSQKDTYSGPGGYALFGMKASCNLLAIDAAARRVRPQTCDVVVLGDADPANAHIVRDLVEADLNVELVGEGWNEHADLRLFATATGALQDRIARMRGAQLAVELPPTVFALSDAAMSRDETGVCVQALEAVAMGVPLLTASRPGVVGHLSPDAQVFTWEQDDDVAALACMLMTDREALHDVGLAGQQRVRSDHRALSRWVGLFDDFTLQPQPLISHWETTDNHQVAVCVVANAETNVNDLVETIASIKSQGASAAEIVLVSSVEPSRSFSEDVRLIVATDADDETLIEIALGATSSGLVSMAQPGDVWCADRIETQVQQLRHDPVLDLSYGPALEGSPYVHAGQTDLTRSLVDTQTFLPGSFMIRRSSLSRLGSGRLLLGASDALIAAATQLQCQPLEQPVLISGERISLSTELCQQPIASLYPEIAGSQDKRAAAGAAFADLATQISSTDAPLAREVVGMALDCLDEVDLKLEAIYSGAIWPDTRILREITDRLDEAAKASQVVDSPAEAPQQSAKASDLSDELLKR